MIYELSHLTRNQPGQHAEAAVSELSGNESVTKHDSRRMLGSV
jgi:hypothetical protein